MPITFQIIVKCATGTESIALVTAPTITEAIQKAWQYFPLSQSVTFQPTKQKQNATI
jgi:hypothetical protein